MSAESATGSEARCPACGGAARVVIELAGLPVHCNLLWATRAAALAAPRADLCLASCGECGHAFNACFDASAMQYAGGYENALDFSPTFRSYAEQLAERLVERHRLRAKTIVEIGCGQAAFLIELCRRGGNRGFGFDPNLARPRSHVEAGLGVTLLRGRYVADGEARDPDLVCCRHVLEHSGDPAAFVSELRAALGDDPKAVVFFEVPNALATLRDLAVWDLIYEHYSYFNGCSLARLFAAAGFDVERVTSAFDGQFLCIEAHAGSGRLPAEPDPAAEGRAAAAAAAGFADRYRDKLDTWRGRMEAIAGSGRRAVVWGAGSKGVTFLNVVAPAGGVEYAVDLNPRKHGMFVAGSGQAIVAPEFLHAYRPDVIVVMNAVYRDEIARRLGELGVRPELVCA